MNLVEAARKHDGAQAQPKPFAVSGAWLVALFSATLVLAAFLLFSLQPMFTKRVLPVLGGTPAVWSVATVVFQTLLLGGYAYAYALTRWLPLRLAIPLHGAILASGFAVLPVAVAAGFDTPPADAEALWLVGLFLASVGLPFFALSASAPLMQAWFARSGHERAADPYFLYRASNAGSFAALIAYPLLIEPLLGLDAQARAWSLGYGALTCAVLACALCLGRTGSIAATPTAETSAPVAMSRRLTWIGLSAVPSGLLVAATAHIATDVASVPLLWVVPLALYLLSFIVAFRPGEAWPSRTLGALQVVGTGVALVALLMAPVALTIDLTVTLALLLVNALIAHRAVYALRPAASRLTEFYLCSSLGGMLGGLFAAIVAPQVFSGLYEYPMLLVAALACRPGLIPAMRRTLRAEGRQVLRICAGIAVLAALAASLGGMLWVDALIWPLLAVVLLSWRQPRMVAVYGALLGLACTLIPGLVARDGESHRSFFGVHRIRLSADGQYRTLEHGTTLHGAMRIRDESGAAVTGRPEPTTYFATGGPIADVLALTRKAGGPIPAVSIVGLGAGSLACQTQAGERLTFFEIDPTVIRIATDPDKFRFLSDCAPTARMIQGDARLTLAAEREKARVLIIDAFSSDAIPMHLLTREALDVELNHIDEKGVLAFHVSNRHFELRYVLARLAAERGLTLLFRAEAPLASLDNTMRRRAFVALITRDPAAERAAIALGWSPVAPDPARRPWTDDYANAIEALVDRWHTPIMAAP